MAKRPVEGTCHICKKFGPLSEEHIPPKAAFNDRPHIPLDFNKAIEFGPDLKIDGKRVQGGVRRYTLCRECNNFTGGKYSRAFAEWCYKGAEVLEKTGGKPTLITAYKVFPLRIIKQIITMMFSVNEPKFGDVHPYLRQFIMNPELRGLPPGYGVYVYYNQSSMLRYHGISAAGNMRTGKQIVFSEISFPPFGYVLCIRHSEPPDPSMFDITHFAKYGYYANTETSMHLPVLSSDSPLPGYYATKEEMRQAKKKNEEDNKIYAFKDAQSKIINLKDERFMRDVKTASNIIDVHRT